MTTKTASSTVRSERSRTRSRLGGAAGRGLARSGVTGQLLWAFHEGFAAYVSRLADGRIDVDGGASRGDDGRFAFPLDTAPFHPALETTPFGPALDTAPLDPALGSELGPSLDPALDAGLAGDGSTSGAWRSNGAVHFTGHHGLLAVSLAAPAVVSAASGEVLTIADPFAPGRRMVLAELGAGTAADGDGEGGSVTRYAEPRLTEAGADLFFGRYREGMPLAPLEVFDASPVSAPPSPVPTSPVPSTPAPSASTQHSPDQDTSDD